MQQQNSTTSHFNITSSVTLPSSPHQHHNGPLPIRLPLIDPVDRDVTYRPPRGPYDPRHMLKGCNGSQGDWMTGFFDRGSFSEIMSNWARTVVTGRARSVYDLHLVVYDLVIDIYLHCVGFINTNLHLYFNNKNKNLYKWENNSSISMQLAMSIIMKVY